MEGWIKLYRQSFESAVFRSAKLWQVWTYCLMRANHKGGYKDFFRGKEVELSAGQFITGRFNGSRDCKMSPSTFQYQITKLKKMGNINIVSDNNKSIITVVNWAQYQAVGEVSDRPSNSGSTASKQQFVTDKKERMKENNAGGILPLKNDELRLLTKAENPWD